MTPALTVEDLRKTFTLHTLGGLELSVLRGVHVRVEAGECVALADPSGAGKSTLLRCIYGNYRPQAGRILVRHGEDVVDMVAAEPRRILEVRRRTVGYVSQFLRVIPRVPALEVVAEPLRLLGATRADSVRSAAALLERLRVPERLWGLSPVTFSGGEQQRINVARGLVAGHPILLLDEPTAALDGDSRARVVELLVEVRRRGAALLGTFHDAGVRGDVSTRLVTLRGATA
ncbi:MAG TPA: phosphonate C-P lyase system protein PhnL [Methylomirabilota bacterium]|nr:phosphonate C-P lyase system protein PhnL [Methylomirabilota bacterium]